MFGTIRTLLTGAQTRSEERLRVAYAPELIEQKIREAHDGLKAAKAALANLIQRERSELRQIQALEGRVTDLMTRTKSALDAGREELAGEGAEAIAAMENELALRRDTARRLETRTLRLRQSVEATNRRIIDLKQGAGLARAVHREQAIQARLGNTLASDSPIAEAEELIATILTRDDPFEKGEILREIDRGLDRVDLGERMAAEGFGKSTKITANDVLARLQDN